MSTQYTDGTFGETKPFNEAMEEFQNAVDSDTAKAFHVGTFEELEKVKDEVANAEKIKQLSENVRDLEARINKDKIIATPTFAEVKEICGGKS